LKSGSLTSFVRLTGVVAKVTSMVGFVLGSSVLETREICMLEGVTIRKRYVPLGRMTLCSRTALENVNVASSGAPAAAVMGPFTVTNVTFHTFCGFGLESANAAGETPAPIAPRSSQEAIVLITPPSPRDAPHERITPWIASRRVP
jgi:hypothetical protein